MNPDENTYTPIMNSMKTDPNDLLCSFDKFYIQSLVEYSSDEPKSNIRHKQS